MKQVNGNLNGQGLKIGIVVAKFNEVVTNKLLSGALDKLEQLNVDTEDITVVKVPGAFEIPRMAKKLAESKQVDGIITLGAVVRGETAHFDYVCSESASGVSQVSLNSRVPVMYGILTTNDMSQALNRAGGKAGNKGSECASDVVEVINAEKNI
ncbi:6,7-dimethyl-8-ribityllumazine synthase [Companilactobacillus futsaii]|uniref:6,7-dimethyl-8-ribityllumazine synthase n=2 Tax=Companilactobacillus futsaii TaxID=938155 RepID=A0A5B7SZ21_9LACO|nr:6,7-dimethyl-8-ribityllumazine synthase [Companilactobacillus futsaii]KRK93224.1 6,7-dimethyl-8-ribityllumazine synthase [Companilactobacillus futsaii JCM 17355]QCX24888.1 6,7-dimethyl-8-ribityllumazine synthase [Companilactobacillus futsaii]